MEGLMQATPIEPSPLSRVRVEQAIASLSDADWLRLKRIAQLRALGLDGIDWEDLVQEALARLLAGSRHCPDDVPFIACLLQIVRSVASEMRQRASLLPGMGAVSGADADSSPSPYPGPEAQISARSELANVLRQFGDDDEVLAILHAMARGLDPSETMTEKDMTEKQYLAAQKRIRRRLTRGIKGGA
jgi:DNA-directed RNA polymerase specialized sigma24 family protein